MNYLWGFTSAWAVYWLLSYWFPATDTLLQVSIYDDVEVIEGVQNTNDGVNVIPVGGVSSEASSQDERKAAQAHVGGI